jgi:hypothetical protein
MALARPALLTALVIALTAIEARSATAQSPVPAKILLRPWLQIFGEPGRPEPPPADVIEIGENERAAVNQALEAWHAANAKTPVFSVSFTLYEYDSVFNPPARDESETPVRQTKGTIRYAPPDKASFQSDDGEKWIVTGDAVVEYNSKLKKVREFRLPKEDVSKSVTDCPYPFLYGPDPELMRRRLYLRPIASEGRTNEIWIEAYPKTGQDATFARAQFILKLPEYRLLAVNLLHHNGSRRVAFVFGELEAPKGMNGCTWPTPKHPVGWKHELIEDGKDAFLSGLGTERQKAAPQ